MTIQALIQQAIRALAAVTETAMLDAMMLLAFVLKKPRSYLVAHGDTLVSEEAEATFQQLLARRLQGEPVAYLIGVQSFWSFDFKVNAHTLIPRPETELLVETALTLFKAREEARDVLEFGTGSGAIALSLLSERRAWQIRAIDRSSEALAVAKQNAVALKLANILFEQKDWMQDAITGSFDLIIANPPYLSTADWAIYQERLRFEPKHALVADGDGLSDIRQIVHISYGLLKNGGYLLIEHGYQQKTSVQQLFAVAGYQEIHTIHDLARHPRVTVGRVLQYNSV